jgi:exodeoxyribonuclease VII small subunit
MKEMNYDQAYSKLEKLVHELEDDSIQLDTLAEKVVQANELIAICEAQLRAVEGDVKDAIKSNQ